MRRPSYPGMHYAARSGTATEWFYRAPCGAPIRNDEIKQKNPAHRIQYTLNKEKVTCLKCLKKI